MACQMKTPSLAYFQRFSMVYNPGYPPFDRLPEPKGNPELPRNNRDYTSFRVATSHFLCKTTFRREPLN